MLFCRVYIHFEKHSLFIFIHTFFSFMTILIKGSIFKILIRNTFNWRVYSDTITCLMLMQCLQKFPMGLIKHVIYPFHSLQFSISLKLLGSHWLHWGSYEIKCIAWGLLNRSSQRLGSVFSLTYLNFPQHYPIWSGDSNHQLSGHDATLLHQWPLARKPSQPEGASQTCPCMFLPLNNTFHTNSSSLTRSLRGKYASFLHSCLDTYVWSPQRPVFSTGCAH